MSSAETPTRLGLVKGLAGASSGLGNWQQILRITIATTLAYVFAEAVSPSETTVLAVLTAMLVVQSSAFATIGETLQRIIGTSVGVVVASVYVNLVGTSMLMFPLGVLIALVLARLMPLAASARSQVVISMLFVLTIGPGEWVSDVGRVIDTAVGGLIAMVVVLAYPPKPDLSRARADFTRWYEAVAVQLEAMAHSIGRGTVPRGERHAFVETSFGLRELDLSSRESFVAAVESAQFNPRAQQETSAQLDLLERDLRWITSVTVQVRALSGEIDRLYDREGGLPPALFAETLSALLLALARLLRAEVHPGSQRSTIERRARRTQSLIAEASGLVTFGRRDVAEVLQSLALLGRLDSLARTIHGGPARLAVLPWDDAGLDEARRPLPPPTGMIPASAPEDDPTMTIGLHVVRPAEPRDGSG